MNHKEMLIPYNEEIKTGTPDSILSSLYRSVLRDLGIEESRFYVLIDKYVNRSISTEDIKELSSIKGNLKKELMKSVMTWKVFIKGLLVINIAKFDIVVNIKIKDEDQTASVVKIVVLDPTEMKSEKKIDGTESVLRNIYNEIMLKLGITLEKFNELTNQYIIRANIPLNVREISSTRGNIKKEILKSSMSWKVFIKGLIFLNVEKLDMAVKLYHHNGKVTTHYRSVVFHG